MSNRFKKFLKGFNIFMVVVLVISTLGVLPTALTPEQVQAAEKVLPNGKYQNVVGETEVYEYKKDSKPRYQQKTTIDYQRPASPKAMAAPKPSPVWFGWIKKTYNKYVAPVVKKVYRAVKRYVAPIVRPIVRAAQSVWRGAQSVWRGAQNVWYGARRYVSNTTNWWAAQQWRAYQKKQAKKRAEAKKRAAAKKKAREKRQAKKKINGWLNGFKKGIGKMTKNLKKSMKKQMSSIKKAFKGLGKIGRNAAKALQKRFSKQLKQLNKMAKKITQMGRYAARYSARYINHQFKKLKKMQKNIHKSMKKAAKQTKRFIQRKARQARVLKKRIAAKVAAKVKKNAQRLFKGTNALVKSVGKGVVVSANWVKSQKKNFLKGADMLGDFLGVKDAYILATGKDWHGNKRSRAEAAMWLAVGFTPVGKAAKGAKMAGKAVKGSKAAKAVTKNIKVNPALRGAYKKTKVKLGKSRPGVKKVIRKIPQPVKTVWVMTQKVVIGKTQFKVTPIKIVQRQVVKKSRVIRVSKKVTTKTPPKKAAKKLQNNSARKKSPQNPKVKSISIQHLSNTERKRFEEYSTQGWKGQVAGGPEKAGGYFGNSERKLPAYRGNGKPITYREFDINKVKPRDSNRFVVSDTQRVYITNDHYKTFKEIK